ncbi:MAG: hypothetical protein ACJAWL_001247 [Motiliproteus sp.]
MQPYRQHTAGLGLFGASGQLVVVTGISLQSSHTCLIPIMDKALGGDAQGPLEAGIVIDTGPAP